MHTGMAGLRITRLLLLAAACLSLQSPGAALANFKIEEQSDRFLVTRGEQPLLVYAFGTNQFKPYLKELRTLRGENILLDGPPDHLHHHGLMYAVRVNGINFWEELADSGRQKHIRLLSHRSEGSTATFVELVHWLAPTTDEPLLLEERTIALTASGARDLILRWSGRFTVGPQNVTLHGTAYNGLGLRLPVRWNGVATHQNAAKVPYSAAQTWDVTAADWAAVSRSGEDGSNTTVALFSVPSNAGRVRFFSMNNPFTYLSVTQNLDQEPIRYEAGTCFALDYTLLLSDSPKDSAQLQKEYEALLKRYEQLKGASEKH